MSADKYQYYRQATEGETLPFAVVDIDLMQKNIDSVIASAKGMRIRVASKSVRCTEVLRRLLDSHELIEGLMCYHCDEAVYLSQQGFDDLLVAYPTVQTKPIERVCEAVVEGKKIILTVDAVDQVKAINKIAARMDVTLDLCLDMDMSVHVLNLNFGVNRSPIHHAKGALKVFKEIEKSSHVRLDAALGYEAQIAGVTDDLDGQKIKNTIIRWLKRYSIPKLTKRRIAIVNALQKAGAQLRFVNGGGTGSIDSTIQDSSVTEVAVGSGFYCPTLFDHYEKFSLEPAAMFAVEVVRKPNKKMVTCLGGGYIASGSIGQEKLPLPVWPRGLALTTNESAGEVQTPLKAANSKITSDIEVGDPVFFRHSKAGELCERFNQILLVQNGKVIDRVKTYRGEGLCFI